MYAHDESDCDADDDLGPEELLEALVTHLLDSDTLEQLCSDADLPVLIDADGDPVTLTARTYRDAGVLSMDRGIYLDLSDGSAFGLTVTVYRRPSCRFRASLSIPGLVYQSSGNCYSSAGLARG